MKKLGLIISFLSCVIFVNAQSKMGDSSDGVKKAKNSKKYDFKITYVNGDTRNVSSTIDINYCMKTMFLEDKENEEAIYPAETKHVEVINKEGFTIKGLPQDSMWIFTLTDGPLKLLSTLPETKAKYAEWIQKKDGDILPFNEIEIERALKDNSIAADYMEKYKKRSAMSKTLGYYIAPGMMFVGFLSGPFVDILDNGVSVFHLSALAVFPVGLLYHRSAKKQLNKAITIYNK